MKEEPLELITQQILRIIRKYYNQLYSTKSDNLEEWKKFLETHNLPNWNHEKTET